LTVGSRKASGKPPSRAQQELDQEQVRPCAPSAGGSAFEPRSPRGRARPLTLRNSALLDVIGDCQSHLLFTARLTSFPTAYMGGSGQTGMVLITLEALLMGAGV
jgi:hypothetical protein